MVRNIQIDFLRFIAILLVILRHSIPLPEVSLLLKGYSFLRTGGWVGVDLFFVLSGYLITSLIITEYKNNGNFNIKRFIIRRGLKIYPLYYLFLLISFLFYTYILKVPQSNWNIFYESIFVANYFGLNNGHLWSICIEEHYYILISITFLMIVRGKFGPSVIVWMYIFFALFGLSIRFYNYLEYPDFDIYRDYVYTHIRIDGLLFGSLLGYLSAYRPNNLGYLTKQGLNIIFIAVSVVVVMVNFFFELHHYKLVSVVSLLLNPIAFGIILINMLNISNLKLLKMMAPFAKIGKYSYAIYLFHLIFLEMPTPGFTNYGLMPFVFRIFIVFTGGIIISKAIEYPIIKFRDRFFPSRYKIG